MALLVDQVVKSPVNLTLDNSMDVQYNTEYNTEYIGHLI